MLLVGVSTAQISFESIERTDSDSDSSFGTFRSALNTNAFKVHACAQDLQKPKKIEKV